MNLVEVNGVNLSTEEIGTGQTVIFVHGIPTDYRVWKSLAEELSKNFRTVSYSRRCAFPNQFSDYSSSTIENNIKDLEELIAKTGGGPVHLIGHSYGGPVVALYTLRHPESVRSLVLVEPYLPGVVVDQRDMLDSLLLLVRSPSVAMSGLQSLSNIKKTVQEVQRMNMEKALDIYYSNSWGNSGAKLDLPPSARAMMIENMETFKELLNEVPSFKKEDARRIISPTLVVSGEHTIKYMKRTAEDLHKAIPNSRVSIIRKASHYPHIENPQECNEKIMEFLSEQAG